MKRNKEGKITIRYFANDRLLPNEVGQFPIYIKVNVKNQQTIFKSKLNLYLSVEELDNPRDNLRKKIEQEKQYVESIVRMLKPFDNNSFSSKDIRLNYQPNYIEINKFISKELLKFLKRIFPTIKKTISPVHELSMKKINEEIYTSRPNIYKIFLEIHNLKDVSHELLRYSEITYAFNSLYDYLFYKTKKKYYVEDVLNKNIFVDLNFFLSEDEIKILKNDLEEICKFQIL